jgi:hypothetical protein
MQPSPYLQNPRSSIFLHISVLCFSLVFGVGEDVPWTKLIVTIVSSTTVATRTAWRSLLLLSLAKAVVKDSY